MLAVCVFVFTFLPALPAQAQFMPERVRLMVAARYAQMEQLVEKELANGPNPNTPKLVALRIA